MKKTAAILMAALLLIVTAFAGAETTDLAGRIEDGAYVLTVKAEGPGEWRADPLA